MRRQGRQEGRMAKSPTRRRLGEILLAADVLTEEELEDALAEQATPGSRARLGTTVVRMGMADEEDIVAALATQLGMDEVDLASTAPAPEAVGRVPRNLAHRHLALPIHLEDGTLTVAVSDPTNVLAKDDLRAAAGVDSIRMVVASESSIREALRHAYGADQSALDALGDDIQVEEQHDLAPEDLEGAAGADDQPIVRLANLILAEAVHTRASDVHVEPGRNHVRIRYRIDGMLREVMRVPRDASAALTSRLKIMARLDIAERRRPQDGRTVVKVEGQEVDLRVSTLPTMFGETVVLRLLRKGVEQLEIDEVGLSPDQMAQYRWALDRPQGLIIITGPTGSGKTTTLYTGLNEIADPVRNIVTLEDPIEYQLEGVNQTQIHEKVGLTFARGLRSVLRQDPDVVLVGEVRDEDTAALAMQASFTGHLVLTTLHTNDAPSSIVRLLDLGVEPFHIASSLLLVVSQRLIRITCDRCAEPYEPEDRTLSMLGLTRADIADGTLLRGTGCEICGRTGFRGREGIFEMLPVTASVRELLMEGATEIQLARLARAEGMRTLREDGIRAALEGRTTLEEVLRVTPSETLTTHRCAECGHQIAEGFVACPQCGNALGVEACRECGRHLESSWRICPYCRSPVKRRREDDDPVRIEGPEEPRPPEISGNGGPAPIEERPLPIVLVVDDDQAIRELVGLMLVDDYDVLEAANGEEAIEMAKRHRPDAVVLDLRLPDMSGVEVTRALRSDEATRWIPILMITGEENTEREVESLVAGVDDYLLKPVNDDVLRGRLTAARRRATTGP
ncbi:MAG: Flp pilus assembly complex ATPase component TadA [Actinobacteria bacterium]|nr:Flp pilus assembly complex ATPase component TadA [Actinomycetota bacterium]